MKKRVLPLICQKSGGACSCPPAFCFPQPCIATFPHSILLECWNTTKSCSNNLATFFISTFKICKRFKFHNGSLKWKFNFFLIFENPYQLNRHKKQFQTLGRVFVIFHCSINIPCHYSRFAVFLFKIGMHVKTVQIEFFAIEIIISIHISSLEIVLPKYEN